MGKFHIQSDDGRTLVIEGDAPPQPDELDELFSAAPKLERTETGLPSDYIPTPRIAGLEPPTPRELLGFNPPIIPNEPKPVDFSPIQVPSMWSEIPKQLFSPSPQSVLDTEIQNDAKLESPITERSKKGEWIDKTYNEMVGALGDWTGNPEKIARVNALKQWRDEEMMNLGFQTVDPFAAPKIERITPQQAGVVFGIDQAGRTAKNIANAQGTVAGVAESFASPEGVAMMGGPKAVAKPLAAAFIGTMAKDATEQTYEAIKKYDSGDTEGGDAALTAAFATAAMLGLPLVAGKGKDKAKELAKAIEKAEFKPGISPSEAALLRSGLPPRIATPEMLPELQRTKELVDQAIQEAQQKIVEPGKVSALELLRKQNEKLTEVAPTVAKPETGFERPAEEVMRGRTVAEKPLTPEVSDAVVKEAAQPVRDVREEPVEVKTEVPQEVGRPATDAGGGEVKVGELPATEAAYNQPVNPEVSTPGTAERKNSYGDPSGTTYHATPEDWSVWNSVKDKPLTEPGVWATREAIKNKYGGMPPDAPKAAGEIVIETPKDIISKLQSLKVDPKKDLPPGQVFSLPHPDAIKVLGKQLWNDAIDVAIAAIKAGRTVKAGIAEAIAHIKRNARNYDEKQITANLQSVLKDEGLVQPARKEKPATSEVPAKAGEGIEVPEGQKARSFSARATVSERVPEPVQEAIKTDERSVYTPQKVSEVEQRTKAMTDAQLFALTPESDAYTQGRAELAQRLFDRGDNESGFNVIQETSETLTRLGQIINQAKVLDALKPESQVLVINETLKKAGKDPLTEAQQKKALETAKASKDAKAKLDAATEAWTKDPTAENAAKAEQALIDANNASLEVQKIKNRFQPKSTFQLLKSILQGNLLTPISQVANLFGNLSFLPFRATTRGIAASMDVLQSAITGRKRTSSVGPVSGTVEAAKGLVRGMEKIPGILKEGSGNRVLGELRQGIHPIRAWMDQFSKNPEIPTEGGKITLKDRLNLLLEGTLGIPAEVMLRGLGAGDQPFREAARARVTAEQLRLHNIPKDQWGFAQKFPELFFDKKTLESIQSQSDYAIFQRQSKTLNMLTRWIASKGNAFDFAAATVAPFKLTPWNIIGEILSYNPVVAFARGAYEAKNGNRREANLNAGKLVVGSMLTTAGYLLYKNGLLSPSLDSRDETMKERILAGQVMPPNHINISGLNRWRKGGDPAFQPGDKTVDVMRSGGLAGAFMYMTANVGRDMEKNPKADTSDLMKSILTQSTLEQARFGMNQSFLSGVEGFLSAIKDGNADNYLKTWANTVTSIPLPNTLTALSRATRESKPDFTADTFNKKIENVLRNRLGWAGYDDYLPLKRGLWGEPLPETPKGRNALFYHFFDVSKGQQITDDPKTIEIYRLWRKTDDSKVIPTPVSNRLTVRGETYMLTPEQQSELAEKVGSTRAEIADSIVTNPEWHTVSDEQKIKMLEKAYDRGLTIGKMDFLEGNQGKLTPKSKKAGFEMQ